MVESVQTEARDNMIQQQIRPWDVLDPRVLEVFERIPRELFVPLTHRALAYSDTQIPIGAGEVMMEPRVEGRMLQALAIQPQDSVLEIGTGSGFVTACLAHLAAAVHSVEIYKAFSDKARTRLQMVSASNVTLEAGDAGTGLGEGGQRFDAIAVTGSLPVLHRGFHERLNIGGRLFVIVGRFPVMEALLITRTAEDAWATESLFDTLLPPLINAEPAPEFRF